MGSESSPIYRYTSIGRPLDPDWPTNRAVLALLPVALVAGFAWTLWTRADADLVAAALSGLGFAAAAFATWALGRELLPDDQAAAFFAMALGLLACLFVPAPGLLIVFATMSLARIVNRSTGLAARVGDSVMVTGLTVWTMYTTTSPWLGALGALAFLLDATLSRPLRRQLLFALLCLAATIGYVVSRGAASLAISAPDTPVGWLAVPALVVFSLHAMSIREVSSNGDVGAQPLAPPRVMAGMAIGALALLVGIGNLDNSVLLIATVGGLSLAIVLRLVSRRPAAA
jgi:hypothetical protein